MSRLIVYCICLVLFWLYSVYFSILFNSYNRITLEYQLHLFLNTKQYYLHKGYPFFCAKCYTVRSLVSKYDLNIFGLRFILFIPEIFKTNVSNRFLNTKSINLCSRAVNSQRLFYTCSQKLMLNVHIKSFWYSKYFCRRFFGLN